jgi:hypothetical protein
MGVYLVHGGVLASWWSVEGERVIVTRDGWRDLPRRVLGAPGRAGLVEGYGRICSGQAVVNLGCLGVAASKGRRICYRLNRAVEEYLNTLSR